MSHQATESFYDQFFLDYENNYHNNEGLKAFVREAASKLPAHAKVLDVGCGTGRPIAEALCAAELDVTGIDLSTEMVEMCKRRFPSAKFIKTDMTKFRPQQKFDAVFAVLSLFHVSHRESYSMLFKFADWLKEGGRLFITTIYSHDLVDRGAKPDSQGIIDLADCQFLSHDVPLTAFSSEKWEEYLTAVGFVGFHATKYDFQPADPKLKVAHHHFITVNRGDNHPLMGPYPYHDKVFGPYSLQKTAYKSFMERLNDVESNALAGVIGHNTNTLTIDPMNRSDLFPFSAQEVSNKFDSIVLSRVLDGLEDINTPLQKAMKATSKIVVIQAAPDNDLLKQANLSSNKAPMHHGLILHRAAEILKTNGFGSLELIHISDSACRFSEEDLSARSKVAAVLIADMFYSYEADLQSIKDALVPRMEALFKETPHDVGNQSVMLVARPVTQVKPA
ncbi:hypothetical protein H112_00527 [Trichophyton rubrum D6]|uniref:phosphoethanolamine N-methyltransferase n=4 Tax=Trichophyton TaxID=5550 RepID=A0A178F8V8_TRIRU|nr:uncharacterized protein TERG_08140 [Trichophyton rubrum CBS 118892]EZF27426.1 hypothetical protein H100_00526 [Trichophyton rubrum MR850]EZF46552.1 hypothetical protein H102_00526 [Trichophyton rubrum CBS 100081]EZF57114.1 hypothetical protein H103_00526 [Trichophyton rubrum CBS 288.86]EZF67810.1 hypothetical protein H104_00516 [Trichophyton rubrum CBS 289.86]EZF78485.1 hypothetical protein H105_00514 [Trichophyton soudanense CBS 452.61]EZF89053.1 hypothetical protein H110_00530 [Trichophy